MFPHHKIHKYTWTSAEGKTHNQTEHVLIGGIRHSIILQVRSFRVADCDTDHHLVVPKVRERLEVTKQAAQKIDTERFNVKKLNKRMLKNSIRLQSETSFQLWKTYRTVGTSTGHGTRLERTSKVQPKRVQVIVNQTILNCGLIRNVQNW
jgi:hypothetical protein